ncbi:hypothetical protein Zmor_011202 [Zophobas morio]|uniref:Uncharacterized protein n=1 Tax=Zophobas morio TaxID=2755281 RepID=A0AA38IKB0_9CUCU|nr:hypothetical protein Zmor_011202 [Zophobas morio]
MSPARVMVQVPRTHYFDIKLLLQKKPSTIDKKHLAYVKLQLPGNIVVVINNTYLNIHGRNLKTTKTTKYILTAEQTSLGAKRRVTCDWPLACDE